MSVPALRQPKFVIKQQENRNKSISSDVQYVIVTLKDERKLVVTSDAYHGIVSAGDMYNCVICRTDMNLDSNYKEKHKNSVSHRMMQEKYPHVEQFSENLIRELTRDTFFCTICNVVVSNVCLTRHVGTDVHAQELEKAKIRAVTYKPL